VTIPLHWFDGLIVLVYMACVLAIGLWVGRGQKTTLDYFLGGKTLPSWALLLSIVATETSTVTFLSIPGITFAVENGDLRFLQITFGYIVGRIGVVFVLLPLYFRGQLFTSYEVLEARFGKTSRRTTSLLFLVTRNTSDALRLYLTALALQQALGLDIISCIVALGLITIFYTYFGGVRSVVWNDCIQFVIYMLGACAALYVIASRLPGGAEQILNFAVENDKLRLIDLEFSLTKPTMTFWAGLIGGMFLTAATHGTDQLTVQRYLAAKSQRGAAGALVASGFVVCLQFLLFLCIGIALACFYSVFIPEPPFTDADKDRVFSHFIVNDLGRGLVGITLAAVFAAAMSTLSSSLNSSATALINDIYLPLRGRELTPKRQLTISRIATAGFGVLQMGIAMAGHYVGTTESTVSNVLAITGFATGPVLGMYFLAVLVRRVDQRSALIGFVVGLVALSTIYWTTSVYWLWYAVIGSMITLASGTAASFLFAGEASPEEPI